MAQGDNITPIAGTKRISYLEENVMAENIILGVDELARLNQELPIGIAQGKRYSEAAAAIFQISD